MAAVGERAAPFRLRSLDGRVVQLQQRLADHAVLVFFSSVGCGPCEESAPAVQRATQRLGERLEVVCVMLSEREAVRRWLEGGGGVPGAAILTGDDGEAPYAAARAYGVMGTPTTFLVGKGGTVLWRHVGRLTVDQVDGELPGVLDAAAEGLLTRRPAP